MIVDLMLKSPPPLVSVITPTFNRADLLRETVESVLNQNYPRVEYLVLDDGSTDSTASLMARYGDRVRYLTHDNRGEARTVNRGFSEASGEMIAVVNSDGTLSSCARRQTTILR
jgi:glycosyltransferase involved in cell wall biosynthesis